MNSLNTPNSTLVIPDSVKDRMNDEEAKWRLEALNLAVRAHDAGDQKRDVPAKAAAYLAFLKTGSFPE